MPYPGIGSSFSGWFVFNLAGPGGTVGANNYLDISIPITPLPVALQGVAQFVIAQAPAVHATSPQLMISNVWLIDSTHVGVTWQNTTGGNVTLPATTYSILIFA